MDECETEPRNEVPLWLRDDPYRDEHGEIPSDELHHRNLVDAALQTVRVAGVFLIIPVGMVLLLLSLVLGPKVTKVLYLMPVLYYFAYLAIPLVARLRNPGDLRLPGRAPLSGAQKRNRLLGALALSFLGVAYYTYCGAWQIEALGWMRRTLLG